jgi:hypothetical protein
MYLEKNKISMKKLFSIMAVTTVLFACKDNAGNNNEKSGSQSKPEQTSPASGGIISFKADGQQVNSEGWVVMRFVWDSNTPGEWINITSNMHKDKRTINVNLNGGTAGKYIFKEGSMMSTSHGSYFPDFSKPFESYLFESGEFDISNVDTEKNLINGTFSGIATSLNGKKVMITDGKLINVRMKPGLVNLDEEAEKAFKK